MHTQVSVGLYEDLEQLISVKCYRLGRMACVERAGPFLHHFLRPISPFGSPW